MAKSSFFLIGVRFSRYLRIVFWGILLVCVTSCSYEKLYIVYDDGIYLHRVDPDNPRPELLLPGVGAISPDASTDSQLLTFISNNGSGQLVGLWNGSSKIKWHKHPNFDPYIFDPSPINSSSYIFSGLHSDYLDIFSSVQGKNITNFRSMDFEPSVSPNGNTLAFTSSRISNSDIYTNERPLSDRQAIETVKEWDLTERGIKYNTYRDHNIDIFTANIDGTNTVRMTFARALDHQPDWSHDGDWIVFSSLRHNNSEIFKIRKDGTGLKRLTNNLHNDGEPAWSPDGNSIAFTSDRSGSKNIHVMTPDGANQIQLTNTLSNLHSPTWIKCSPGIFGKVGTTCP